MAAKNTDGHKCLCGCGRTPAGRDSLWMPGHHPPLKGKDNPLWKGDQGTAGSRAFARIKQDPKKMEERRDKRRKWEKNKRKSDPEWYKNQLLKDRNKSQARKVKVLNHYGGKCACCGETRHQFLCIDHEEGGGNKHRREDKLTNGKAIYQWLINNGYPKKFRVLCHNCNFAIGAYGECPHTKEVLINA